MGTNKEDDDTPLCEENVEYVDVGGEGECGETEVVEGIEKEHGEDDTVDGGAGTKGLPVVSSVSPPISPDPREEIGLDEYELMFFQDLAKPGDDGLCPPALIPRGFLRSVVRKLVQEEMTKIVETKGEDI